MWQVDQDIQEGPLAEVTAVRKLPEKWLQEPSGDRDTPSHACLAPESCSPTEGGDQFLVFSF